jgi:hypothetical protein
MAGGRTGTILRAVAAAAVLTGIGVHPARATTVFTDGFGDADRNNDGATDGGSVTNAADVGIKWFGIEGSSAPPKPTFVVQDDSAGIGAGNALHAEARGAGSEWIGVLPSQVVLGANLGDKIVLSLKFRVDGNSPHGVPVAAGGSFRFGLYEDADNEFGTSGWGTSDGNFDSGTAPGAADDPGWFSRVPLFGDVATNARIFEEAGNNGDVLAGTGVDADQVASGSLLINDALTHTLTMTLERVATGVLGTLDLDGTSISGTETTAGGINTTTFEYLVFNNATVDFDYFVDSFQLDVIAVPEPSSLALLAFGVAGLLKRTRRNT